MQLAPVSVALTSLLLIGPSLAQDSRFAVQLDNDIILGSDGDYTGGLMLNWYGNSVAASEQLHWLHRWRTPLLFGEGGRYQAGISLQQRLWTPKEIALDTPQPTDRPYAGVLQLESSLAYYNTHLAQKSWLSVGVIGPSSQAAGFQKQIHRWTGSTPPQGWQYQVQDQFIAQYAHEVDWLVNRYQLGEQQLELSTSAYGNLGNLRSEALFSMNLRYGRGLEQSFGGASNHFNHNGSLKPLSKRFSYQPYMRIAAGYRFHDLTITGKVPYDNLTTVEPLRIEGQLGVLLAFNGWGLDFSLTQYHKDYQQNSSNWQRYAQLGFYVGL
ncbi:exonuclease [Paraferrimonas haliotis]|uniref:Exonuclease n=1 Tax=Paraferrimonas haliotis TaxID=2013866 RepID=A0AA37TLV6_9GAMM|nr:exonuclease [Paraferrimonas haliotis]